MKKLITILLVLSMLFAMTACNSNSIVGKWKWEITMDGAAMNIEDFDGDFTMNLIFEFKADGRYAISLDEDDLKASIADFEADLVEYMVDKLGEGSREYAENLVANMNLTESILKMVDVDEGMYTIDGSFLTMTPDDEDDESEEFEFAIKGKQLTLTGECKPFADMLEMMGEDDMILNRVG